MKPTPDPCILQRVVKLSKDPDLIEKLTEAFAPGIIGHKTIKQALLLHLVGGSPKQRTGLRSRGTIHVLLIGDPGTGKTHLLRSAEALCDVVPVTGTGINVDGLTAMVTVQNGAPTVLEGALVKADQKHLHIDKLDKMTSTLRSVLETAMEQQYYPYSKNGVTTVLDTRVSVLATSNPCLGRYNLYQTLAQNINLPVGLLTCFDLIYVLRDSPDNVRDRVIAEKILEMDTPEQSCNYLDRTLLRAYLEEASKRAPMLSLEAKTRLRDFYLDIRRASDQGGAVSITPRQLLSLIRLSEAQAKLHLRDNVSEVDVEAAVRIFSESLEQVGVDPVTHHYDIDVLFTGRPTVLNSKLLKVVEAFSELEKFSALVKETDLHETLFERFGFDRRTVSRLLRTLVREEFIKCTAPGVYRRNG